MQIAISTIVTELGAGRLKNKRANALLYGLQLAATNLRRIDPAFPWKRL